MVSAWNSVKFSQLIEPFIFFFRWESYNTIYGRTLNPYDTTRIAGGSNGGEACLQVSNSLNYELHSLIIFLFFFYE